MPPKRTASGQVPSSSSQVGGPTGSSTRMTRAAAAAAAQAGNSQQGSMAPSIQSSRPSMSSYRYSNGRAGSNSGAALPSASGSYMMNAPAVPQGAGRPARRVYRELMGGKEVSVYPVEDDTPAPLPGTTGGQQKRKASSNAGSLRSTATYNGAMSGNNGMSTNGYHHQPQQPQPTGSKRRKPEDGYGYYPAWDERASAVGSVRTNGKAGVSRFSRRPKLLLTPFH